MHSGFNLDGPAFELPTDGVIQPHLIMLVSEDPFNLDGPAFELPTDGVIQPHLIMLVSEDPTEDEDALVNPHLQPPPVTPENPPAPLNTEDSVMAHAPDLRSFQEFEGYRYGDNSGSDCDVPEDPDDSDDSDDHQEATDEIPEAV